MDELYKLLQEIRLRPEIYIGKPSLERMLSTRSPFVSETEGISETELGGLRQLESRLV
jgi:hypothetical protein